MEELLDRRFYEPNGEHLGYFENDLPFKAVHPRRNFLQPTRVNLSMSLYQILEVVRLMGENKGFKKINFKDERKQSIVVNVWMVQDWYDEVGLGGLAGIYDEFSSWIGIPMVGEVLNILALIDNFGSFPPFRIRNDQQDHCALFRDLDSRHGAVQL